MIEPLACLNGALLPASQLQLPVYDTGFVQGVTVAEQLRTFGGQLFRLPEHLSRLAHSLEMVGLADQISLESLAEAAAKLVANNHPLLPAGADLGLSMFVTPGPYAAFASGASAGPTIGLHTYPLPFHLWARFYEAGQALVVPGVRQVPPECWPAALKCRSRMHYYLADREARQIESGARALLLDLAGRVTEASTANVVLYREAEGLVSPPRQLILPGVSVAVLEELASQLGLPFAHRELSAADVAGADEVMLCSTSPCVWPCVRLNGRPIGTGRPGPIVGRLLAAWSDLVGLDIAAQAQSFSV